jgi:predicted metal-dependent phosphoesterase TrpH
MTTGLVDLHLHSTASDGTLTPTELVREAAERGVTLIALTDHDTTDGVAEATAAARESGVRLIPGVELSAETELYDVHILGLFLRVEQPALQEALARLRTARQVRNEQILERLRSVGAPVSAERVQEISGAGSVGRPHIAAAMVEAGYVASQGEAFYRYLGRGKPAFVRRARLEPVEACRIVKDAGGIPVLAHPAKVGSPTLIDAVIAQGVKGLEAFHSDQSTEDTEALLALAKRRSLLVTGGTDSHGPASDRSVPVGGVYLPPWVGERVLARAPQWWREAQAQ